MAEFKAAEYLKMASRERVTYSLMVPAMYNLCLLQPDFDSHDSRAGASAALAARRCRSPRSNGWMQKSRPEADELLWRDRDHVAVDHDARRTDGSHIDSVGLPCPGAQIVVMDANGRELPRGEIGEIWIHGGSVIKGYWNNPKATAESFTAGFWHSGDLGSID